MAKDTQHRKFQITINNPEKYGATHEEIEARILSLKAVEYFCMADEIGAKEQTFHTHVFVCFLNPKLFSTIKKKFPEAHIEPAKGTCQENRDYIQKNGKWAKSGKAETSIPGSFYEYGTCPMERSAPRREADIMDEIQEAIDSGMTPREILAQGVYFYKHEAIIRKAYFGKRFMETPIKRDIKVYYHVGKSGSGKSYEYIQLCEKYGEDNVYFVTDYANGGTAGFDKYNGEPILFLDEFKSNLPYGLLLKLLDEHKADVHCRYANTYALWNEVHITSVFPPEELYAGMVSAENRKVDSIQQFYRRISFVVYHKKFEDGSYFTHSVPMAKYSDYYQLQKDAEKAYISQFFELI